MTKRLVLTITAIVLAMPLVQICNAEDSDSDYVLLLKQSPADGGVVDQTLGQSGLASISATPKNGYKFVYWLGDVAEPTSPATTVSTEAPKLVIAVFERVEFESELPFSSGGGGYNQAPSRATINGGGPAPSVTTGVSPSAPGAKRHSTPSYNPASWDDDYDPDTDDDGFPVPGDQGDEVPEPTSLALFSLASLVLLKKRNRN